MPHLRAVLLDALGTLVELEPPWPRLRRTLADRHGVEVSEQDARRALLAEMAHYRAHHQEGFDRASLAALRRDCARVLAEHLPEAAPIGAEELTEVLLDSLRFTPYPDAAAALARLRAADLRLAVVSNWDCSLPHVLAQVGLAGALDTVVVSAAVGAAKPDPRIFRVALERLRCDAGEALMVGDSLETDIVGARQVGVRAILIDRSGQGADDRGVERIGALSDVVHRVASPA